MSGTDGCANDCVPPLRFPRRPGENPPALHGAGCPCCRTEAGTSPDNRPALPHFNYRIGTYGSIREWLLHQVDKAPNLQGWTHRAPDDPAVALLEGAAILGDILAFYQDTYANEAFLRTARWRESISDLVRLLGYRLSPAIGGKAVFAFELKKEEPVRIPAGFPLKADLEGSPVPSLFETKAAMTAYPWLSRFHLYRPLAEAPFDAEFEIELPEPHLAPVELKVGERLMLGESGAAFPERALELDSADIYSIESIRERHGVRIYKVKGKLKDWPAHKNVYAYRIGRTFHHFGHNGPARIIDPSRPVESTSTVSPGPDAGSTRTVSASSIPYLPVPFTRPIGESPEYLSDPAVSPPLRYSDFPLEMEVPDLVAGAPVVIQARFAFPGARTVPEYSGTQVLIRTIGKVEPMALTWGGMSGSISRIRLAERISDAAFLGGIPGSLSDDAREEARRADQDEEAARDLSARSDRDAADARSAAEAAAREAIRAKEEAADLAARADAAIGKAATLALAYAVAASALKDNATDAAVQAATAAAAEAATAANAAKSSADAGSGQADDAAAKAATARSDVDAAAGFALALTAYLLTPASPGNAHLIDPVLDGFVAAVDIPVVKAKGSAALSTQAADTAKSGAAAAKTAAGLSAGKAGQALQLANVAKAAAAEDADAVQRAAAAKQEADAAKAAADQAVAAAAAAKQAALEAERDAEAKAASAGNAARAAETAAAEAAVKAETAREKNRIKETRMYIGDALFHEVTSPKLKVKAARIETPDAKGAGLGYYGTAEQVQALLGRRILLQKKGYEPGLLTVEQVPADFPAGTRDFPILRMISVSAEVDYSDFPHLDPVTEVYGNLAEADEGKTLPGSVLGSGDATLAFQTFQVPKAPLTYHIVPENGPPETPAAEVYVEGRQWTRVDSFFGRGAGERIYIVREDAAGNSWVQFGDGKTGSRLPSGPDNVTLAFRTGAGAHGPLKDDAKVQALAALKNLDKVRMPGAATGGAPAEDGENARAAAPGKVQSLGRMVSIKDFEAEAAALPGVTLASAAWRLADNLPAVVVTVLMDAGRGAEIQAVRDILAAYNTRRGAGRNPIRVSQGKRMFVALSVRYALQEGFRADGVGPAIRRALGAMDASGGAEAGLGLFGIRRRKFGGPEYASSVEGTVQNVPGVLWAQAVAFAELGEADDPEDLAMPADPSLSPIIPCDAGRILALHGKHLLLTAVKAQES